MVTKHRLANLKINAERNPISMAALFLTHGKIEGDEVFVDDAVDKEIRQLFPLKSHLCYKIAEMQSVNNSLPAGYADFILTHGKIVHDMIVLNETAYKELRKKYPRPITRPLPPTPSLTELAHNFAGSMTAWANAGFKTVEREKYEQRHSVCTVCEYWKPDARLGLGKCKKCGCSRIKLWLATSRCPDKPPRWQ